MAVPKRKMSRSNTRSRRSQWKATPVATVACPQCRSRAVEQVLSPFFAKTVRKS